MVRRKHVIIVDHEKCLKDQPNVGHNRWHPDIPPILEVNPGDTVVIQCRDGVDGQVSRHSTHEDVRAINAHRIHPLTGPIFVRGAEPGDLLEVKIIDIETTDHGVNAILGDSGFLQEISTPYLVHWELSGGYATSKSIPGVRIPGKPHMGIMGVAPSKSLLGQIVARQAELIRRGQWGH